MPGRVMPSGLANWSDTALQIVASVLLPEVAGLARRAWCGREPQLRPSPHPTDSLPRSAGEWDAVLGSKQSVIGRGQDLSRSVVLPRPAQLRATQRRDVAPCRRLEAGVGCFCRQHGANADGHAVGSAPLRLAWVKPFAKPVRACSSSSSFRSTRGSWVAMVVFRAIRLAAASSWSRADSIRLLPSTSIVASLGRFAAVSRCAANCRKRGATLAGRIGRMVKGGRWRAGNSRSSPSGRRRRGSA